MRILKEEHTLWCLAGARKLQGLGLVGVMWGLGRCSGSGPVLFLFQFSSCWCNFLSYLAPGMRVRLCGGISLSNTMKRSSPAFSKKINN
jgi:hypothetical protein